ncbi:MAG TPA: hypothetical protein VGC79_22430 [Polyangiaceae bacterium]
MSTLACGGAADVPDTPDLRELQSDYENPTASLNETSVVEALRTAPPLQELAAGIDATEYIMGDVNDASINSSNKTGSRLRLQGSIKLHVRCPGERSDPNFDEAVNGSISLTLALSDNRIHRSFGGEAKACVLKGNVRDIPASIRLDGPIAFDMGGDVGVGSRWSGSLLAYLPGVLTVAGIDFKSISARRTADGTLQHLVRFNDKTIIFELSNEGITIRDSVGVWFCSAGESCARR